MYGVGSGEWPNAVSDLFALLGDQSADSARAMCDVLCEMAEDARDPQLVALNSADARARVAAYLSTQLPAVLDRMQRLLSATGGHSALRKAALLCVSSWLKNAQWQPPAVLSHPVIDSAFSAFAVVELEEVASQCVLELIRGVDEFCLPSASFQYWEDEDGEIRHDEQQHSGAVNAALSDEQLAAQHAIVQRVTQLVPLYSQYTHPHSTPHRLPTRCVSALQPRTASLTARCVLFVLDGCFIGWLTAQRLMWRLQLVIVLVYCVSCSQRWPNHYCATW